MARQSVWDEQRGGREVPRPTLPVFSLDDYSIELEARAAAARVAERRIIRTGLDAWQAIGKAKNWGRPARRQAAGDPRYAIQCCLRLLPPDQAAPLWQAALAEAQCRYIECLAGLA